MNNAGISYFLSLSLTRCLDFSTKVRPNISTAVDWKNKSRKSNCWQTIARMYVENAIYHGFIEQPLTKIQFTASATLVFSCFFNPMLFFARWSPFFHIHEVKKHLISSPKHFYRGRFNFQEPFFQSTSVAAFFSIFHIFPMVANSYFNFSLAGKDILRAIDGNRVKGTSKCLRQSENLCDYSTVIERIFQSV